jgi:hypothetical protein
MTKNLLMIAVLAASTSACQQDTKNIERKLDQIIQKLDRLPAGGGQAAAGAANPRGGGRPEPDRSKTYAVPIEGDSFEGPADALVTIVKAIDYA